MTTSDPRTLAELQQALRNGTMTVRQLMLRFLKEQPQQALSAWISRPSDEALLAQADACDARLLSHGASLFETQPLLGMPPQRYHVQSPRLPRTRHDIGDQPVVALLDLALSMAMWGTTVTVRIAG